MYDSFILYPEGFDYHVEYDVIPLVVHFSVVYGCYRYLPVLDNEYVVSPQIMCH